VLFPARRQHEKFTKESRSPQNTNQIPKRSWRP
jgi:hypothetical protein